MLDSASRRSKATGSLRRLHDTQTEPCSANRALILRAGSGGASRRSDLYSMGVLLYQSSWRAPYVDDDADRHGAPRPRPARVRDGATGVNSSGSSRASAACLTSGLGVAHRGQDSHRVDSVLVEPRREGPRVPRDVLSARASTRKGKPAQRSEASRGAGAKRGSAAFAAAIGIFFC